MNLRARPLHAGRGVRLFPGALGLLGDVWVSGF